MAYHCKKRRNSKEELLNDIYNMNIRKKLFLYNIEEHLTSCSPKRCSPPIFSWLGIFEKILSSLEIWAVWETHILITVYLNFESGPKSFAQKVSGYKVSKIDNIGQQVSSQNYLNKNNEHYHFSYYIINSVVGSKADSK